MEVAQRLGLGEYFGSSIRRRQASGFVVTENQFPAGLVIPLHEHIHAHFTVVLSGGFTETCGAVSLECLAGSILLVPQALRHSDEVWSQGAHTLGVELSPRLVNRVSESTEVLREPRVIVDTAIQRRAERLYAEFRSVEPASLLALESIAMEILVLAARSQPKAESSAPRWMPLVMEALHASPKEGIPTQELADIAGVHESHLCRTFRRTHGCTVGEYVRWLRLEEAKGDLRSGERTIAEIAVECGFYDQAHFSRAFRSAFGVSPSAYRKVFRSR